MTPDDYAAFEKAVRALAEIKPGDSKPQTADGWLLYFGAVSRFPLEVVLEAIRLSAARLKWFPDPAALAELIEGSLDDRAALAWSRVYNARGSGYGFPITFEDPVIHATVRAMGGWHEIHALCFIDTEPVDVATKRKTFIQLYIAITHRGVPTDAPAILAVESAVLDKSRVRHIGSSGDPLPLPGAEQKALAEPSGPGEDCRGKLSELLADLSVNHRPPERIRRREIVDRPLALPPTPQEQADHERRKREALAQLHLAVEDAR